MIKSLTNQLPLNQPIKMSLPNPQNQQHNLPLKGLIRGQSLAQKSARFCDWIYTVGFIKIPIFIILEHDTFVSGQIQDRVK